VDAGNLTGDTVVRFRCEGQHPSYAELKTDILAALAA
jgi:hypothetical protein